jgi:hypothetical protein
LDQRKALVNLGGAQFDPCSTISPLSVYGLAGSFLANSGGLSHFKRSARSVSFHVEFRRTILSLPQCKISKKKVLFFLIKSCSIVLVAGGESEGASRGRGELRLLRC